MFSILRARIFNMEPRGAHQSLDSGDTSNISQARGSRAGIVTDIPGVPVTQERKPFRPTKDDMRLASAGLIILFLEISAG
jgi:hypothetical protein